MLSQFQNSKPSTGVYEFECRFEQVTGITYKNVIRYLLLYEHHHIASTKQLRIGYNDNLRAELRGESLIQSYCLTKRLPDGTTFDRKTRISAEPNSEFFISKMALSTEEDSQAPPDTEPKHFRTMTRLSFHDPFELYRVDCSIVKSGDDLNAVYIAPMTFEIEVEFLKPNKTSQDVFDKAIRNVLRGLQDSHYPICKREMEDVRLEYYQMLCSIGMVRASPIKAKDVAFMAPKPITLQHSAIRSLYQNYYVTRKTDGVRKLLMVAKSKRVYLISAGNNNVKTTVQYTGIESDMKPTLLDGEHVTRVEHGHVRTRNTYFVFDCYLANGEPTIQLTLEDRMYHAEGMVQLLRMVDLDDEEFKKLIICIKPHDHCNPMKCSELLENDHYYKDIAGNEYNVDGLIFTPPSPITTFGTLYQCYKWKPCHENTVDFMVTFNRDDLVKYDNIRVKLFVSYIPKSDQGKSSRYALLNGIDVQKSKDFHQMKLVHFNPTMGLDIYADVAVVNNNIYTERNEVVDRGSVVECKYDSHSKQWILVRIRWDKMGTSTPQPNMMATALSVWETIKHPITPTMLVTPSIRTAYYPEQNVGKDSLRTFHNAVKSELIQSVMMLDRKYTVLDFAVGRGGDIFKYGNRTKFLLGIDLDYDNIFSQIDSCGLRYVQGKMFDKQVPEHALFLHGNSTMLLDNGDAFQSDIDKQLFRAITVAEEPKLFPQVQYGICLQGFDITSIQFALHYMFESPSTIETFVHNLKNYTAHHGSFIATCFDGAKVEHMLAGVPYGETFNIDGVCSITKWFADGDTVKKITVKQVSIGEAHDEWLVNKDSFAEYMGLHGFTLEHCKSFEEYNGFQMLSKAEKQLSALNMTLHFKKQ
jgi:hypothetical protein